MNSVGGRVYRTLCVCYLHTAVLYSYPTTPVHPVSYFVSVLIRVYCCSDRKNDDCEFFECLASSTVAA